MSHLRLAESLADVAKLRATIAVVVRIAEYVPVRLDVGEAHRVALRNLFEAHVDDGGMTRMTSDLTHAWPPLVAVGEGNGNFSCDFHAHYNVKVRLSPCPYLVNG